MDDLRDIVNRLGDRIEGLEKRVATLEGALQAATLRAPAVPSSAEEEDTATGFALPQPTGVFPVIGKAMLGIAGAYLLRAISESAAVPQIAIVVIALTYAATWLVWATRAKASTFFVSLSYSVTSALILAPMLAELTLRFHILASSATAALLIAFVLGSVILAWKRNLLIVAWVGVATAVCTSIGLMVLSRDMVPFVFVILVTVMLSEGAAARKRWLSLRGLVAPAAVVAVWTLLHTFSLPDDARVEYVPVAKPMLLAFASLLFLIYGASVAWRTLWARERISAFEIIQTAVSFVLAGFAWFWFARAGLTLFGLACWLLAVGSYGATFVSVRRGATRNYHVYGAWGAALVLAGAFLVLTPTAASLLLSAVAIGMTLASVRLQRLTPGYQGLVYIVAAALTSDLLRYIVSSLVGTLADSSTGTARLVAVGVIACCVIAGKLAGELWDQRLLRVLFTLLSVTVIAAFLVSGLLQLTPIVIQPSASAVAAVRTLVFSLFALGLAFAGARWQRIELVWSAYCGLAFLTVKLLFEDLRIGHSGAIAFSTFLYAIALMLVPRLGRAARRPSVDRSEEIKGLNPNGASYAEEDHATKALADSALH